MCRWSPTSVHYIDLMETMHAQKKLLYSSHLPHGRLRRLHSLLHRLPSALALLIPLPLSLLPLPFLRIFLFLFHDLESTTSRFIRLLFRCPLLHALHRLCLLFLKHAILCRLKSLFSRSNLPLLRLRSLCTVPAVRV